MGTLDLNNPPKFTNNLQKNILLLKNLGKKFIIKNNDIELPSLLYLSSRPYNPKIKYYSLVYDIEDRYSWLMPFKVDFIDMLTGNKNNNCYIANLHKTKISGTDIMLTLLKLLKLLHVEMVILNDGAHVFCDKSNSEIDLSLFKLIEKGITFYQRFGFEFMLNTTAKHKIDFGNKDNLVNTLKKVLNDIHKIKISYYKDAYINILNLINQIIKNQDYDKVKIYLYHPYKFYLMEENNVKSKIIGLVSDINNLLGIIKGTEKEYLVDFMIDEFYIDCGIYVQLEELLLSNAFAGISYKGKKIFLKHHEIFDTLNYIRNSSLFGLKLN